MTEPALPPSDPLRVTISKDRSNEGDWPDLTKLASIAVGVGFFIGLLYNVGFFLVLDLRLFPLLTYKDHLETLVIFTPIAIVPIVLCLMLRSKPARRRRATIGAGGLAAATFSAWTGRDEIAGSPAFQGLMIGLTGLAASVLAAYCVAVVVDRGLRIHEVSDEDSEESRWMAISIATLGLLVFVTMLGGAQSILAMRSTEFGTMITMSGEGATATPRPAHLVRAIDNGLLVVFRDAPRRIAWVRNDAIRLLSEPTNR